MDFPLDEPPGNPPKLRASDAALSSVQALRQAAAMRGHPPGCGLPGAFRRGGRVVRDTAADGNRCGRSPVSCPVFAAEQGGIVRVGKKEALSLPKFPYSTHYAFFLLLSAKNAIFFFLRARSPAASFPPLYAYGRKDSFIPVAGAIAEREKASGTFFLLKDRPLAQTVEKVPIRKAGCNEGLQALHFSSYRPALPVGRGDFSEQSAEKSFPQPCHAG